MTHQGKRIDEVRKQIGITKAELARRIWTSNQNLHSIFLRKEIKSIEHLKNLSDALNHDFLGEFYHSNIDENQTKLSDDEFEKEKIEKYKMQGRIEQLEEMIKNDLSTKISDQIIIKLGDQIKEMINESK